MSSKDLEDFLAVVHGRTELLDELRPIAERLGSADELEDVRQILERGASYQRQRAVMADKGTLVAVVDSLVHELATDEPGAT